MQTAVCNLLSAAEGCGGGGFWSGVSDAGGAFVDGLIRGDFNRDDRTTNGWTETARGLGQFASGLLVVGDVRDGGAAVEEIWSSGGRDGWGDLLLSGVGLVPLVGDAIRGVRATRCSPPTRAPAPPAWVAAGHPGGTFAHTAPYPNAGVSLARGAADPVAVNSVRVVLHPDPSSALGYFILTSYPVPP